MRSGNRSPMATSFTGPVASSASRQAPVPRLPQPTKPMRITSLPAACAERARLRPAASEAATEGAANGGQDG